MVIFLKICTKQHLTLRYQILTTKSYPGRLWKYDYRIIVNKLTQRDRNGIINRYRRKERISELAERYGVSRQTIYAVIKEYKDTKAIPVAKKPGRKKKTLTDEEKQTIRECYAECNLGADWLRKYIAKNRRICISKNKIHEYLLSLGYAEESSRKKRQRKYRKYERHHSMTLWHTDWKEIYINSEKKYLTVFIDDRSRYVTCFGVFDEMTTENTLLVLKDGIDKYGCPEEIITDNGSQYCSVLSDNPLNHGFGKFLNDMSIKHIRARVRHPQTNGKVERFFKEVDDRLDEMKTVDAIVHWQNCIKVHGSLCWHTPEYVFWRTQKPERILDMVKSWFWTPIDACASGNTKM